MTAINKGKTDMATKKGTKQNDVLKGDDGDDMLRGLAGSDTLFGGDGNDRLDGGKGDDELLGGDGNDLLLPGQAGYDAIDGGKGIDTVSYANYGATSGVMIQLTATVSVTGKDAIGDTFFNIERFVGSNADDSIEIERADAGEKPYLAGGDGDDVLAAHGGVMRGGDGSDTLWGDFDHVDTFWFELDGETDKIERFTDNQDKIRISGKEFGIGSLMNSNEMVNKASDSNPVGTHAQFIFRNDTDQLFFDPDGTGAEATVLVADFAANSPIDYLFANDFEVI